LGLSVWAPTTRNGASAGWPRRHQATTSPSRADDDRAVAGQIVTGGALVEAGLGQIGG
jgi:hypothetical protein